MVATTQTPIPVSGEEWTQLSAVNCVVVALQGNMAVAYALVKPADSVSVYDLATAHLFRNKAGMNSIKNTEGGIMFGRALPDTGTALAGITTF